MKNTNKDFLLRMKTELENREVVPTRDLWLEISARTTAPKDEASFLKYIAAACLLLTCCLGLYFLIDGESSNESVRAPIAHVENSREMGLYQALSKSLYEANDGMNSGAFDIKNSASQSIPLANSVSSSLNDVADIEKVILLKPAKADNEEVLAGLAIEKTDSIPFKKERKKFVDAATLLFSVEHKDVINNTKDGSNVATIDLNSK